MTTRGFDANFLEELKSKNDIVAVISKYVPLTRKGANYWACCPFHGEKTPSFAVRDDRQFYKCYGCGESGDVINFIEKYENVDFITAVKMLCDNCGMKLPEYEMSDEQKQRKKERDRCFAIMRDACEFYQKSLLACRDPQYINYIKSRSLNRELIDVFKIGLSPDFESIVRYMHSKGYNDTELIKCGVVGKNDRGNIYDFYAKRITFPIMNSFGDVIAFSARTIEKDSHFAKYKNTPQTPIFTKGQTMYGINNLRTLKRAGELKKIILVEGQMDVIACYKAGCKNTVGSMGTALTPQHADELYRLCDKITLCLDGDNAGIEATIRAINILKKKNFDITVARLKNAKDPDEFINKFGPSEFNNAIDHAEPANDFVLSSIASRFNLNDNVQRTKCVKYLLEIIAGYDTDSEREIYLEYVQKLTGLGIGVLRRDLSNLLNKEEPKQAEPEPEPVVELDDSLKNAILYVLAYLIYSNQQMPANDHLDRILTGELLELKIYIQTQKGLGKPVNVSSIFDMFEVKPNSDLDKIINFNFVMTDDNKEKYYQDCLNIIDKAYYAKAEQELRARLKTAKTSQEMEECLKELSALNKKLK